MRGILLFPLFKKRIIPLQDIFGFPGEEFQKIKCSIPVPGFQCAGSTAGPCTIEAFRTFNIILIKLTIALACPEPPGFIHVIQKPFKFPAILHSFLWFFFCVQMNQLLVQDQADQFRGLLPGKDCFDL